MKLIEKIKTEFSINTSGESGRFADKCEKISDEFAVEFAQWVLDGNISNFLDSPVELLEIYKKEKNL